MAITLKAARVNAGLQQKEAAKLLGIVPETLSRWERGLSFPKVEQINMIENLYHVSYADINFLPTNIGLTDIKESD
jgi:transcriptional regulator with XRE-family HTH domain